MGVVERDYAGILARFFSQANRVGLVSAYLFGSQCTGRTHRQSDMDVAVLLDWRTNLIKLGGPTSCTCAAG